jgi:endonuclease YncB( thermonuclease family)
VKAITLALLIGLITSAQSAELVGRVTDIDDGDSFYIRGARLWHIRLCGVDSPENRRRRNRGREPATAAITGLIGGKTIRCTPK